MADFKMENSIVDKTIIVRTTGYIDAVSGQTLLSTCMEMLNKEPKGFLLNLTGSPIVNSSGMSCILDLVGSFTQQHEIQFWICGLSNLTTAAFRTCGILALVKEAKTEAEAMAQINNAG